jgi:protein SCO1/2
MRPMWTRVSRGVPSLPRLHSRGSERALDRAARTLLPLLFLASAVSAAGDSSLRAGVFSPPRAAPDFSLRGSDGAELRLSRYRGKVVILAFGFTACPDVCPTTLATLAGTRKKLGAQANQLQVVYITVDPETDNPERMREYLASFDPTFVGGTGTTEQLAAVRQEYGIATTRRVVGQSHTFSHSSYTYLIDRNGSLRALMPYGQSSDDYVHDVRILLTQ